MRYSASGQRFNKPRRYISEDDTYPRGNFYFFWFESDAERRGLRDQALHGRTRKKVFFMPKKHQKIANKSLQMGIWRKSTDSHSLIYRKSGCGASEISYTEISHELLLKISSKKDAGA